VGSRRCEIGAPEARYVIMRRMVPRLRRSGSYRMPTHSLRCGLTFRIRAYGPWIPACPNAIVLRTISWLAYPTKGKHKILRLRSRDDETPKSTPTATARSFAQKARSG
jgi:hypothetical protein